MKSTWVAAGLLLLTICQAAKDNPGDILTIESVTSLPTNKVRVCFSGAGDVTQPIEIVLIIKDSAEHSSPATDILYHETDDICCSSHQFTEDITIIGENVQLEVILQDQYTAGNAVFDSSGITIPACDDVKFFDDLMTLRMNCAEGITVANLELIEETKDVIKVLPNSDWSVSSDKTLIYLLLANSPIGNGLLSICDTVKYAENKSIRVCSATGNVDEMTGLADIKIETETIDYQDKSVTITTANGTSSELYYETTSKSGNNIAPLVITTESSPSIKSVLPFYDPKVDIDYLLVQTDFLAAHKGNIPGYEVQFNLLSDATLEISWINVDKTQEPYTLKCETDKSVNVYCSGALNCYGYFMDTATCSMELIPPQTNGTYGYTLTIKDNFPSLPQNSAIEAIEVRGVQLQWSDELQTTEAEICFQHQTTEPQAYEGVIINSQGEWRRGDGIVTLTSRGVSCIKPMVVLETEFLPENQEITVIVLQRDEDSRRVLASGEAKINANISY